MAKGWHRESRRHALARAGVKTAVDDKPIDKIPVDYSQYELIRAAVDDDFANVSFNHPTRWSQYKKYLQSKKDPIFKKIIRVNEKRKKMYDQWVQDLGKDSKKLKSKLPKKIQPLFQKEFDKKMTSKDPDGGFSYNAPVNADNFMADVAENKGIKYKNDKYQTPWYNLRLVREFSDAEKSKISKLSR